jgi:predicted CopG family antitoxin
MSIKTVALNTQVYEKLARHKRGSESFTKTIDRLLAESSEPTCADAVRDTARIFGRVETGSEADRMEQWIRQGKDAADWTVELPE